MILEDTFIVDAAQEAVWNFFLDIPQVSACTPGVAGVEQVDQDIYNGTLKVKVGPIQAAFSGRVAILERTPPERLLARIEGRDRTSASNVSGTFSVQLAPEAAGTRVTYQMDFNLRGRLAQFGLVVVQGTAKKMTAEFVRCLQEAISAGQGGAGTTQAAWGSAVSGNQDE